MRKIRNYLNKWMEGLILIGGLSIIFLFSPGKEITFLKVLGTLILVAFSVAILFLYFRRFIRGKIRLLSFLLLSMVLMGKVIILIPSVSNYFIPIAYFSILIYFIFSNLHLSIIGTLLLIINLTKTKKCKEGHKKYIPLGDKMVCEKCGEEAWN